jgi:hypothetical protein
MDEMPLRGQGGCIEFIGQGGDLLPGLVVGRDRRLIVAGLPRLSSGSGLSSVRDPVAAANFGPVVDPVNGVDQRRAARKAGISREIRTLAVHCVVEHEILAGFVF